MDSGEHMDYAEMLYDAWRYMRQGVFENSGRWLRLILAFILLAIPMNGYLMRIYRGAESAPEVDQWGRLFIDGLKLMVISIIYMIPFWLLWFASYWPVVVGVFSGQMSETALAAWQPNLILVVLMYIVEFVIALLLPVVAIRFARTNRVTEAFNFRAIVDHIARIGWINYIIGVILVGIIIAVPVMLLVFIFIILGIILAAMTGFSITAILGIIAVAALIFLAIAPFLMVFQARYWTRLYDGAAPVAESAAPSA
jgi:hypothetical protein